MKEKIVRDKSFDFATSIVATYKTMVSQHKEYVLSRQLLKSGTSIGALIRESEYAESKADFIHKLSIAQKEANETMYWLELLFKSEYLPEEDFSKLFREAEELLKLLTAILKTSKANINN